MWMEEGRLELSLQMEERMELGDEAHPDDARRAAAIPQGLPWQLAAAAQESLPFAV
jgi:hypothetical protein